MSDRKAVAVFVFLCALGGVFFAALAWQWGADAGWVFATFLAGASLTGDVVLSA